MTSVFSWQNSISLCPASFRIPRPYLPVTPGVSWLPTFAFRSPIMKRTSFLGVLEGLVDLHRAVQPPLLQHYWSGHRLGLLWYWMVCLGDEQRSFCCFWDCIQVLHLAVQGTLKSLLQHHSSKVSILWCSAFFTVQLADQYMTTGKTIALTRRTLVGKVMSLLFNMLSRLVITFLPRSKL